MVDKQTDKISGVEDTGHEWDGIRELNNPLPRWWVWVFLASIIWGIGYWIVMPAWPLLHDYTHGVLGYNRRALLASELKAAREVREAKIQSLVTMPVNEIVKNSDLMRFAMNGGRILFSENCAACHGHSAAGQAGYPNLLDDDWLWDGSLEGIEHTITVGIRATHAQTRMNDMPAFKDVLKPEEIAALADWLSQGEGAAKPANDAVKTLFADNCAACHGDEAKGNGELGAPNLTDAIWLYGGDKATIVKTITSGRAGVMPTWEGRLANGDIRMLALYVYGLGGGKAP